MPTTSWGGRLACHLLWLSEGARVEDDREDQDLCFWIPNLVAREKRREAAVVAMVKEEPKK